MVLTDSAFLWAFAMTFFETLLFAASGGLLGIALENGLRRYRWRNISLAVFFSTVSWVPFLLCFALPLSDNKLLAVFILGTVAVGLHTCSDLHSLRTTNPYGWHGLIRYVAKYTILQALLFRLFAQLRFADGWIQFFIQEPGRGVIVSAIIVLTVFLFFLDRLLRYSFYDDVRSLAPGLKAELTIKKVVSFLLLIAVSGLCLVVWQLTGEYLKSTPAVNHGLGVVGWFVHRLFDGGDSGTGNLWKDLFVSNLEVWGGVIVSGALAFCLSKILANESMVTRLILFFIPIIFVTPIFLPMLLPLLGINRLGDFSLSAMTSIAFLTFFPFLKVVEALRHYHKPIAVIVGFKVVLPFAYIGMLVGELYGAVAGLGFRIVSEQASGNFLAAMAVSLITMISLLVSIFILCCATISQNMMKAMQPR